MEPIICHLKPSSVGSKDLNDALNEFLPKMQEISTATLQSHLSHPRMKEVGGWDMVVGGSGLHLPEHIAETFELYKNRPRRIATIVERQREIRRRKNMYGESLKGIDDVMDRSDIRDSINDITITVRHSPFHNPPEDINCLKLEMLLGSRPTDYGSHESIYELRIFVKRMSSDLLLELNRMGPHIDTDHSALSEFYLVTYRRDAERALRNYKLKTYSRMYAADLYVGWERTPIHKWLEEDQGRQQKVKAERKDAGSCIMCGEPLGKMQRLFGTEKHKECEEYLE